MIESFIYAKGQAIVSRNLTNQSTDAAGGGFVWHRLHSEREQVCETLLLETRLSDLKEKPIKTAFEQRREQLFQTRLLLIDQALDRLAAGRYGECCVCGKWIEDTKLGLDPAFPICLGCERKSEGA